MNDEVLNAVCDPKDPNFLKNAVIHRLKDLCDRVEGADKCTICEAIHILESQDDKKADNSLWMLLLVFILFGFNSNPPPFDLDLFSKVLNESERKTKEEGGNKE